VLSRLKVFAYLGSISLSPDSITFNREMGLISRQPSLVQDLEAQFESDFHLRDQEVLKTPILRSLVFAPSVSSGRGFGLLPEDAEKVI
jgi:phosphatidylserine/phosphatidylglycerophosphate/cardiolipin synthase-like enzyme